jgi:hypothetical protein
MSSTQTVTPPAAQTQKGRSWLGRRAAVLAGALLMMWPAFYNGFPLLYPDSMTYLGDGPEVARKIFLHQSSNYYGMRSLFYSLGVLPLHWNITAWPIVALQCVLMAYILWLVVRSILPRHTAAYYLVLVAALSLLTSLSWYVSMVMPDILGPALYFTFYLLVFARETLSPRERLGISAIACWAVTSHATHMMLAVGLSIVLVLVLFAQQRPKRQILSSAAEVGSILAIAAAAQLVLHGYLYGKPSLNGERPPYLMARVIADGTGRKYLEQHCAEQRWTLCAHVQNLAGDADHFLWDTDGGWGGASLNEQTELRREEMPFVVATLRAYPKEQISRSLSAFWQQLQTFGIEDLDPSTWVAEQFDEVLPGARSHYLASRQARNNLHIEGFTAFQIWVVRSSLVAMIAFLPLVWRRVPLPLAGLSVVIISMVVANAFVTGTMSMVDERYGSRVIWMVPLLEGLFVMNWFSMRGTTTERQEGFAKNFSTSVMSWVRR